MLWASKLKAASRPGLLGKIAGILRSIPLNMPIDELISAATAPSGSISP